MADVILQEIKDRLNVAEVIATYIPIKRAGGAFKAVCPFHNEKSPSLMISPQKQIWHCFGCGAGGDIFGFVMRFENVEFKDALKILADRAGVVLPAFNRQNIDDSREKELLIKINEFAAKYYHAILLKDKSAKALQYIKSRGLNLETIRQWQIGYAPEDFHALEKALEKKGVKKEDLVKAGLSVKNEKGQIYDRFRGRVTFPVQNYLGEVVGFSARILVDDNKSAKYINSPETLIYSKSKILFGLNFAKNSIRKLDEVVVVEGQMDCVTAHQSGFTNVVASSGTALTQTQLDLLGRLTRAIKLCFDADAAGLSAMKRAVELYLGKEFIIKVIPLDGAKDPDELIRQAPGKFAELVKKAPLFLDFYIDKAFSQYNSSSIEQKKNIAKEILPFLRYLTDPLEQDHYIQLLAEKFNTTPEILRKAMQKTPARQMPNRATAIAGEPTKNIQHPSALEKEVLGGMLVYQDFFQTVLARGEIGDFESLEIQQLLKSAFTAKDLNADKAKKNSVVAQEAVFVVESLLEEMENDEQAAKRQLHKSFAHLRLQSIKRKQKQLALDIKIAEQSGKKADLEILNKQFASLISQRMQFEQLVNY